jgi:PXPV repeat (3 copies)
LILGCSFDALRLATLFTVQAVGAYGAGAFNKHMGFFCPVKELIMKTSLNASRVLVSVRSVAMAGAAATLAVAALGFAGAAQARDNVFWSVGVGSPGVEFNVGNAPQVYVQPAPVYVQPAPVYVQPAPVYYPRPVYVQPQPVYVQPRPVYVQPAPIIYGRPGWRERRDGYVQGAGYGYGPGYYGGGRGYGPGVYQRSDDGDRRHNRHGGRDND